MEYEPLKQQLRRWIGRSVLLRKLFYRLQGLLFLREWYVKRMIRHLPLENDTALNILDAGTGFGQYTYYCIRHYPAPDVLGIEINPDHVTAGNGFAEKIKSDRLRFEQGDITALAYRNEFDLILCVDLLEHIRDDRDLLQRFCSALKPGGCLIISTPSVYRKHQEDGQFVGEHFREGYSEDEIRKKLEEAGFRIDTLIYAYGFWGDLSWRMGIRNSMKLLGYGLVGKCLAPLYMLLVLPLALAFMVLDYWWPNRRGTGFIVLAEKAE